MRIVHFLPLFGALCAAQAPAPAAQPQAPPPEPPSTLVKPALDQVDQTITTLRFDRWKKGSIRDEASQDSDSIANNLHRSLPPLLEAVDAAPTANSKLVPAFQNIDAVYDVLLRIYSAARVVGQPEDVDSLQKSLTMLSQSRRALAARMQDQAAAQEKQIVDLRTSYQALQAQKNAPPPKPEPCVPAKPKSRAKPKHSAAATTAQKPAATPSTTQKPPK
jgi:hypothetical protein